MSSKKFTLIALAAIFLSLLITVGSEVRGDIYGIFTLFTRSLSASGQEYEVRVTYGAEAEIPTDAQLVVDEVEGGEYLTLVAQEVPRNERVVYSRFFDIRIVDGKGEKIQPKAPVDVEIRVGEDDLGENVRTFHFLGSTNLHVPH